MNEWTVSSTTSSDTCVPPDRGAQGEPVIDGEAPPADLSSEPAGQLQRGTRGPEHKAATVEVQDERSAWVGVLRLHQQRTDAARVHIFDTEPDGRRAAFAQEALVASALSQPQSRAVLERQRGLPELERTACLRASQRVGRRLGDRHRLRDRFDWVVGVQPPDCRLAVGVQALKAAQPSVARVPGPGRSR
jgi:hypothetical protein